MSNEFNLSPDIESSTYENNSTFTMNIQIIKGSTQENFKHIIATIE
jgi:hypothetical protein